jgi:UDP-3-O-[3-hydroxymyristoyl] glucosamine N-acyltransferase
MKLKEIVQYLQGELINSPGDVEISGCAKLDEATNSDISFLANLKYKNLVNTSKAAAIIVSKKLEIDTDIPLIKVNDPYLAFALVLEKLYPQSNAVEEGIASTSVVAESSDIGKNVSIGHNCFIGKNVSIGTQTVIYPNVVVLDDVSIGANCIIYPNVTIREKCVLQNRVILQPGCVIGSDGFGFAPVAGGYKKIPQVGNVILEDDVEIGANTTIDRSTTGSTVIKSGTKLDNLVQIAHNVKIGRNTVIAGLSGVAGSTEIGQSVIAGNTGVMSDTESGKIYFGTPAREHRKQLQIEAALSKLPEMVKKIKRIEKHVQLNVDDGENKK